MFPEAICRSRPGAVTPGSLEGFLIAVIPKPDFFGRDLPVLAYRMQCWQYACMSVQITIRDVPEKVRLELAARAAAQGRSMQEFLRMALEKLAARPTADSWLAQVRRRKRATQSRVSAEQILSNRDADRR